MKSLKAVALAVLAWVWGWIVWTLSKIIAALKGWGDYMYDPPPRHIKYWVVMVLIIAVGGSIFGGAVVSWFDRHVQAAAPLKPSAEGRRQPMYLLPPSVVITTTRPAPEAAVDVVLPTAAKVITLPAPVKPSAEGKRKVKRKPSAEGKPKTEAWSPF